MSEKLTMDMFSAGFGTDNLNSSQKLLFTAIFILFIYRIVKKIPQIIMAVSLYKEGKRHGKNKVLWALLGCAFPILSPIGIYIYIKLTEKELPDYERKGFSKKAVTSAIISFVIILVSFALAVSAFLVGAFSFYKSATTDEHIATFYDRMGNEYNEFDLNRIDMYSDDGKKFKFEYGKGLDAYYVAEDGTKLDADKCFIDEDGWFFYDENSELLLEGTDTYYLFDSNLERYKDKDGKKYYTLGSFSYWFDENGDLYRQDGRYAEKVDFESEIITQ